MRVVQNEMNRPVCSLMPLCAMLLVSFCIYLDRDMHWRSMHNHLKAQNTRLLINLGFSLSCLSVSRLLYAYHFRTFDEEDIFFVLNKIASEHSLYFWCFRFSVVRHPSMLSLNWTLLLVVLLERIPVHVTSFSAVAGLQGMRRQPAKLIGGT